MTSLTPLEHVLPRAYLWGDTAGGRFSFERRRHRKRPRPSVDTRSSRGGPLAATREFLRGNKEFVVDASRERYILTNNPEGYLKRIR